MSKTKQKHFKQPKAPRQTILTEKPFAACAVLFILCLAVRCIDCFLIRTDKTWLSMDFIHQMAALAVVFFFIRYAALSWEEVGFDFSDWGDVFTGFLGGVFAFVVAYVMEMALLNASGQKPKFALFLGDPEHNNILWLLAGIVLSLIVTFGEVGLFQGIILKSLKNRFKFSLANILTGVLYGVWYIIPLIRTYGNSEMGTLKTVFMIIFMFLLGVMMGCKWNMLAQMKDNLWTAFGDRLFLEVFGIRCLHMITDSGSYDSMLMLRIIAAQIISCFIAFSEYNKPAINLKKRPRY